MQGDVNAANIPFTSRVLLALAGALLPADLRTDWIREWRAELWHSRRSAVRSDIALLNYSLGAFADAWFLLRHEAAISRRLAEARRSRSLPIAAMAVLLIGLSVATNGFQGGRDLLFGRDSDRLFLLAQPSPFLGSAARVPAAQVLAWIECGSTVEKLGRWAAKDPFVCVADPVAATLFAETHAKARCDTIQLAPDVRGFSGVIGRLKPGARLAGAEKELAETAVLHRGWLVPQIVPIGRLRRAPLLPVGTALLGLALISLLPLRTRSLESFAWAVSRVALSFALVVAGWLELTAAAPFTEQAGVPSVWAALLYVCPIAAGTLLHIWLRRDARGRCRTCYRPLTMPVFVGLSGRCLFDSGGIERLCSARHGALVTGSVPGQIGTEEWSQWPNPFA